MRRSKNRVREKRNLFLIDICTKECWDRFDYFKERERERRIVTKRFFEKRNKEVRDKIWYVEHDETR